MRGKRNERNSNGAIPGRLCKGGDILDRSVIIFEYQYFRKKMKLIRMLRYSRKAEC